MCIARGQWSHTTSLLAFLPQRTQTASPVAFEIHSKQYQFPSGTPVIFGYKKKRRCLLDFKQRIFFHLCFSKCQYQSYFSQKSGICLSPTVKVKAISAKNLWCPRCHIIFYTEKVTTCPIYKGYARWCVTLKQYMWYPLSQLSHKSNCASLSSLVQIIHCWNIVK